MHPHHGDLFQEIGKLVVAAHAGQSIDLAAKSEEMAERYGNLGMPAELIAKAIARSLGAISVSLAVVSNGHPATEPHRANGNGHAANGVNGNGHPGEILADSAEDEDGLAELQPTESQVDAASALFPSGLRLAVIN